MSPLGICVWEDKKEIETEREREWKRKKETTEKKFVRKYTQSRSGVNNEIYLLVVFFLLQICKVWGKERSYYSPSVFILLRSLLLCVSEFLWKATPTLITANLIAWICVCVCVCTRHKCSLIFTRSHNRKLTPSPVILAASQIFEQNRVTRWPTVGIFVVVFPTHTNIYM